MPFEALLFELLASCPEFFLLVGAPELPRRAKFVTVRRGAATALARI